jgi:hypothetical protein
MRRATQAATLLLAVLLATLLLVPAVPAQSGKPRLTLDDFASLVPTRVADKEGTPGDMVNFVLVGSREQVVAALEAAGWQPVDRTTTEAILAAILVTLDKKVYVTLPMSELFLFDRAQDFGYARGDPIRVVAERHHFRLWEAPWQTEDGQTIWLGAGTYDAGFEEHQRTGSITHKIDPEVDKERDFIAATLRAAGRVAGFGYASPPQPVRDATTAHGGPFRSDGRIALLLLK